MPSIRNTPENTGIRSSSVDWKKLSARSASGVRTARCAPRQKQTVSAAIKKFWKLGYLSFEESKTDRRIRLIRFTAAGKEYVERIIPPAAQAENDAMAELSGEQQAELIRLTDLFSEQMRLKFQSINKNTL